MKLHLQMEPVGEKHVESAYYMVLEAYEEEKKEVPFLPDKDGFQNLLRQFIQGLFSAGVGIAAVHNNELVGFLAGYTADELFGRCKGIYSPLYGHGAIKQYRSSIYQELYRCTADRWVSTACMTHAITFFAHDKETIDTWFWQGFGMRCIDALRKVEPVDTVNSSISLRKADPADIPALADIHSQHNRYYRYSPIFMPRMEMDPIQDLTVWMKQYNHHLWAAYDGETPLGYMRIEPSGETFVSEHPNIMNITGAYVIERARESGVGTMLLAVVQEWIQDNGYSLCGVDFESINNLGSHFWTKYFIPYTYSLVRRIDERVL